MTYDEFQANVLQWAKDRGILEHGTYQGQCLKLIEEYGELAAAWARNDREGVKDALGDIEVVKVIMEEIEFAGGRTGGMTAHAAEYLQSGFVDFEARAEFGLSQSECFEQAWNTIKDRKGKMNAQGVFVKEAE